MIVRRIKTIKYDFDLCNEEIRDTYNKSRERNLIASVQLLRNKGYCLLIECFEVNFGFNLNTFQA